jgi:hypothetical protein
MPQTTRPNSVARNNPPTPDLQGSPIRFPQARHPMMSPKGSHSRPKWRRHNYVFSRPAATCTNARTIYLAARRNSLTTTRWSDKIRGGRITRGSPTNTLLPGGGIHAHALVRACVCACLCAWVPLCGHVHVRAPLCGEPNATTNARKAIVCQSFACLLIRRHIDLWQRTSPHTNPYMGPIWYLLMCLPTERSHAQCSWRGRYWPIMAPIRAQLYAQTGPMLDPKWAHMCPYGSV